LSGHFQNEKYQSSIFFSPEKNDGHFAPVLTGLRGRILHRAGNLRNNLNISGRQLSVGRKPTFSSRIYEYNICLYEYPRGLIFLVQFQTQEKRPKNRLPGH
jgi:hypothetical protein